MAMRKWAGGGIRIRMMAILGVGALSGLIAVALFGEVLAATNTDRFCLSCHNHDIAYEQQQLTPHFRNATGVSPGCADCHVQKEFLPKMQRKIEAAREVWGHLRGTIDTVEKYREHQPEMRAREFARFRTSDSATCRSCHDVARMDVALQSPNARRVHEKVGEGKTCVDCHDDAGHAIRQVSIR